jgi:hypothetical protein
MSAFRAQPLEELRARPHTSVSAISCYVRCPAAYEHRYLLRTPPSHRPAALAFGSAVHSALAVFYEHLRDHGEKPPVEQLHDTFSGRMDVEVADTSIPLKFDEGQDAGQQKDLGVAMLTAFHEQGLVPDGRVVGVEVPFSVDVADPETGVVGEVPLVGAVDAIVVHGGRHLLLEHKTAAKRFTKDRLEYDFQPSAYVHASRSLGILRPGVAFQVLLKGRRPSVEVLPLVRTDAHVLEMLAAVTAVQRGIAAGVFFRNRGWACSDCGFGYRCGG